MLSFHHILVRIFILLVCLSSFGLVFTACPRTHFTGSILFPLRVCTCAYYLAHTVHYKHLVFIAYQLTASTLSGASFSPRICFIMSTLLFPPRIRIFLCYDAFITKHSLSIAYYIDYLSYYDRFVFDSYMHIDFVSTQVLV